MDDDKITVDEQLLNGPKTNKERLDIIKEQMINCICRKKKKKKATEFFIKFRDRNKNFIKVLMTNSHVLGIDIIKKDEENIFYYIYNNKSKKEEEHKMEDMNDRRRYVNGKPLLTLIFNYI